MSYIQLKRNSRLFILAEQFVQVRDENNWSQRKEHFYAIRYQAGTWKHTRRTCIRSVNGADELIFNHKFIITKCLPRQRLNFSAFCKKFNLCLGESAYLKNFRSEKGVIMPKNPLKIYHHNEKRMVQVKFRGSMNNSGTNM